MMLKIKNWHNERLSLEERKEENILSLGSLKNRKKFKTRT